MSRDYPARRRSTGDAERERRRPVQPTFRLFVAVDIPAEATAGLVRWQQEHLAGDRSLRLVPEEQLHITLAFLGQMGEKERDLAAAELDGLAGLGCFEAAASTMVGLPRNRHPRVIAAVIDEPAGRLAEIHGRLAAALVEKKLYKREKRPYFAHVTIARARHGTGLDPSSIHPEPVKFTAVRVTLYNSILKREGALHEALKTVQLI